MAQSNNIVRQPVEAIPDRFPFGADFQVSLLKLLVTDTTFAHALSTYLEPTFFEAEPLSWAWDFCLRYREQYDTMPTLRVLLDHTRGLDTRLRPLYTATLEAVELSSLKEESWLRDQVLEFVRRNIFVRAFRDARLLYNKGNVNGSYDLMMGQMEKVHTLCLETVDREWVCDDLPARHALRLGTEGRGDSIATGFRWLDKILEGGLHPGELGLWIAEPKTGKTTLLVNLGIAAARLSYKNVLHCVLEGSRKQVLNRYDSAFSEELYSSVKTGDINDKKYEVLLAEYKMLSRKLVVRAFVERWDYTILDIHEEIRMLKREYGWDPQALVIDYGDLLDGRGKYSNETEKQRASFRDIKSLANRGYGIWSASQTQRPKDGDEDRTRFLRSRNIADCYDKIRVADFIGSINLTLEERKVKVARLLAEYYRDNEAESWTVVRADFAKMVFKEEQGLVSPSVALSETGKLGKLPRQLVAGF